MLDELLGKARQDGVVVGWSLTKIPPSMQPLPRRHSVVHFAKTLHKNLEKIKRFK